MQGDNANPTDLTRHCAPHGGSPSLARNAKRSHSLVPLEPESTDWGADGGFLR
jgi:hypothetical protein